ncbi:MAG: D-alanyl-D-alanine carboxypeptidase/D-alanyl-D-alanine-endopeptidase [Calditrichaeota bacterium]|nr:D-alanyl-D-alanine carboxypeptidase/D-alanyl-D-alanine-endopeptidase [Calditrichota bacterium]
MRKNLLSKLLKLFILAILFTGCSHNPHLFSKSDSISRLQKELDLIFSDPSIATAQCGVAIKSLATGEIVYFRNARKALVPGSNLKLFTTAAALLKLGPQYQFHTNLYMNGNLEQNGVLNGDLILSGTGDPSISAVFHKGNSITVFENFCDSLKKRGVKKIFGRIIGDDNYFDDEPLGAGWAWDYQSDWYAAQISALSFNDNCLNLLITPGDSAGVLAGISIIPSTDYVQIENKLITIPGEKTKINVHRIRKENRIICSGTIAPDQKEVQETVTVENPTLYSAHVFKEILERRGIAVDGEAADIDDLHDFNYSRETARRVAQYNSPPLREIITITLKESKNLYAELLLRTLGKESTGVGNAAAGTKTVCQILTGMGIDTTQISMEDGSGLSRKDFITPMSVVTLLTFMSRHPFAKIFYDSLPVAGVDGTLAQRMLGTAAAGNVHAKTGTLDFVKALSGYVTSRDGEKFVFSILINNYKVSHRVVNRIQDTVCERLANFVRR